MSAPQTQRLTDFTFVDLTVEQMGGGGFGVVYMGPDRLRGRWMALKTLRPELLTFYPHLRDLFLTECLTWVGLWPHRNLLPAVTATEIDGRIYLVLNYAEGGSLRELLTFAQPLATRLAWAQHVAAGLLALHTPDPEFLRPRPLVHRDLKPDNVLVDASGFAMITDFGLAAAIERALVKQPDASAAFALVEQLAEEAGQTSVTHTTRAMRTSRFQTRVPGAEAVAAGPGGVGTFAYMPPEQWIDGGGVGTPADLYAFGLLLSELLAGRHALTDLEAELDQYTWRKLHLSATRRPLRSGPAEGASRLPVLVEQLYQALLAQRAEDRPTAGEALSVLRQAAAHMGEQPYTPPDAYPRTEEHCMMRWTNWASTCFHLGRVEEALARSERALSLDPRNFNVLNLQGNIIAESGTRARRTGHVEEGERLPGEALGWFEQANAVATTNAERAMARDMTAVQLSRLGRYAEAEDGYAAALALDGASGPTWFNRANNGLEWANTEVRAGRKSEAQRLYTSAESYAQQAVRLSPNRLESHRLLTEIQREIARLDP